MHTFMASANRQLNQDQAYELAASLGESINLLIQEDKYDIYATQLNPSTGERDIYSQNDFQDLPDASVVATVSKTADGTGRLLTVKAAVGGAEYVYTREYRQ